MGVDIPLFSYYSYNFSCDGDIMFPLAAQYHLFKMWQSYLGYIYITYPCPHLNILPTSSAPLQIFLWYTGSTSIWWSNMEQVLVSIPPGYPPHYISLPIPMNRTSFPTFNVSVSTRTNIYNGVWLWQGSPDCFPENKVPPLIKVSWIILVLCTPG